MTTLKGLNSKDDMSPKLQTSDSGMDEMRCMFPDTDTTRLREVMEAFNRHKDAFEINTPLRIAHFLGQIAVESSFPPAGLAPFEALQESCNYSNVRNTDWGTRYCHFYVGFEDTTLNDCTHSCVTGTLSLMEDGCPEPIKTDLPECTPIEAICDDGVDNDGDGLVDCDDEECMDSTICDPEIYCEILSLITITQRDFNQLHYSFERDGSLDHTLSRLGELGLSTALTQQLINNLQTVRYDIEDSFLSGTYSYKDSVYLRLATMRQNFLSWKMNAFTKYPVLESTSFARKFILKSSGGEEQPSEEACEEIIKILIDGACENQESALSCHGIANVAGSGQTFLYFEPNISPHLLNKSRIYDLANGIEFVTSFKPSSTYERVSGQGPFLVITQDVFGCITSCIIEPEACSVDEDGQHIDFDTINVTHGACIRSDILIQGALSCGTLVEVLFNLDILKAECISYQSDEYGPIESDFEKICPNEDGQITITITDGFNIIVVDSIYINSHPPYNIDGCDSEDDQNCDDTENEKDNDTDGDGTDNEFDNDDDGDGIPDLIDTTPQGLDSDIDDDEVKNEEDCDLDGDNSPNQLDNDTDGDLIDNELDPDDDNDGILDIDDESPQGLETECIEDCMTTDDEDSDGLTGCEDPDCIPQLVVQKIEVGESECGENNGTISVQLAGNQSFENFRICVGDSCSEYGVNILEGIALGEYTLTIEKQGGCAIQYTPAISLDSDSDGNLNGTDKDINNDSIPNIEQTDDNDDADGDGIINLHDYDDDNDGILDEDDPTPFGPSEEVCDGENIDEDGDGHADCFDTDCSIRQTLQKSISKSIDTVDCNLNCLPDCIEIWPGTCLTDVYVANECFTQDQFASANYYHPETGDAIACPDTGRAYIVEMIGNDGSLLTSEEICIEARTIDSAYVYSILKCAFDDTDTIRLQEVAGAFARYADQFEINTPLRIAHFLGQIGHESSFLNTPPFEALRESCYYSENNLRNNSWGRTYCNLFEGFADENLDDCEHECTVDTSLLADTLKNLSFDQIRNNRLLRDLLNIKEDYLENTMDDCLLMDLVYSCRNGNGSPATGDGSRYRGAGLIHLTWYNNYDLASQWWNEGLPADSPHRKDFTGDDFDDFFNEINVSMKVAMLFWQNCPTGHCRGNGMQSINDLIEGNLIEDDIRNVTRAINGDGATPESIRARQELSQTILECLTSNNE